MQTMIFKKACERRTLIYMKKSRKTIQEKNLCWDNQIFLNRRREPSWQIYGEVAGPKLELQRKIFQEIIMKSFRVIKVLNTVPNTINEKNRIYHIIILSYSCHRKH